MIVKCNDCNQDYEINSERFYGEDINCTNCGATIYIPYPEPAKEEQTYCSKCENPISIPVESLGQIGQCPHCHNKVIFQKMQKCPHCSELIKADAKLCMHCKSSLVSDSPVKASKPARRTISSPSQRKIVTNKPLKYFGLASIVPVMLQALCWLLVSTARILSSLSNSVNRNDLIPAVISFVLSLILAIIYYYSNIIIYNNLKGKNSPSNLVWGIVTFLCIIPWVILVFSILIAMKGQN